MDDLRDYSEDGGCTEMLSPTGPSKHCQLEQNKNKCTWSAEWSGHDRYFIFQNTRETFITDVQMKIAPV